MKSLLFVPSGESVPRRNEQALFLKHLDWTRTRYREPFAVELTGLAIHSQHSGRDHEATAMKLAVVDEGESRVVAEKQLSGVDAVVTFPKTTAKQWKLTLRAGKSKMLVIRGLRFLSGGGEVVPHMVPYRDAGKDS